MAEALMRGMGARGRRPKPSSAHYAMEDRADGQPTVKAQEAVVLVEVEHEVRLLLQIAVTL